MNTEKDFLNGDDRPGRTDFYGMRQDERIFIEWLIAMQCEWVCQHEVPLDDTVPEVAELIGHLAAQGYAPDAAVAHIADYMFA